MGRSLFASFTWTEYRLHSHPCEYYGFHPHLTFIILPPSTPPPSTQLKSLPPLPIQFSYPPHFSPIRGGRFINVVPVAYLPVPVSINFSIYRARHFSLSLSLFHLSSYNKPFPAMFLLLSVCFPSLRIPLCPTFPPLLHVLCFLRYPTSFSSSAG